MDERKAFEAEYERVCLEPWCGSRETAWKIWQHRAALSEQAAAVPADCDVRRVMLDCVPGEDGMGLEVYAKSVADVEALLTEMGDRIEQMKAPAATPQPAQQPPSEAVSELYAALQLCLSADFDCAEPNAMTAKIRAQGKATLAKYGERV
jgi:hypothetical protein